jgi:hypothetical protein
MITIYFFQPYACDTTVSGTSPSADPDPAPDVMAELTDACDGADDTSDRETHRHSRETDRHSGAAPIV